MSIDILCTVDPGRLQHVGHAHVVDGERQLRVLLACGREQCREVHDRVHPILGDDLRERLGLGHLVDRQEVL